MAEKHVHKVYGSFPPWGKSVEFPATGGGGGNYVYIDTSSITEFGDETDLLYDNAYLIKEQISNGDIIVTLSSWRYGDTPPLAVCIDLNLKMTAWDESGENPLPEMTTLGKDIAKYVPWILDLPRLTEEEFYKIVPKFAIIHHGGGENVTIHEYEEGMTWGEWVNSDYNTINALISDNNQVQILIPNNDWNATLGSKIDGWLYSDNIIKSEQYDAYY